jgi:hypothetical protein
MFKVKPPIELMKAGKPAASHDILDDKVFDRLCQKHANPSSYGILVSLVVRLASCRI